jgi:hypothetical protein
MPAGTARSSAARRAVGGAAIGLGLQQDAAMAEFSSLAYW